RRWLRGRLRPSGSLAGGLLLLWLSVARRACSSWTWLTSSWICASSRGISPTRVRSTAFSASNSAMRSADVMPPSYAHSASLPDQSRQLFRSSGGTVAPPQRLQAREGLAGFFASGPPAWDRRDIRRSQTLQRCHCPSVSQFTQRKGRPQAHLGRWIVQRGDE